MRTETQVFAMNLGLNYKDLILLTYLKDNFFIQKIKGIDIRNRYPIFFSSSKDIATSFSSLIDKNVICGNYSHGAITSLSFNEKLMIDIFFSNEKVIKEKKKQLTSDEDKPMVAIISYYRSFNSLPRPAAYSDINISLTKETLDRFSDSEIREAIEFASTSWYGTEIWRKKRFSSYSWFIRNVEGFMVDGKYRGGSGNKNNVLNKTDDNDDDVIL